MVMLALKGEAKEPLRIHPDNPRYFTDGMKTAEGSWRAVYLTGSHTWNNFQDPGSDPVNAFDYKGYLDFLEKNNHNFFRLWTRMGTGGGPPTPVPTIYQRTGPGKAKDGGLKYDLSLFNEEFFGRLRERVKAAHDRGIYVAVMFFGGDNVVDRGGNPNWPLHPYHQENNVNGINGDANGDGQGTEFYTLRIPGVSKLQEAYIRKVIQSLSDFDNVLWEVGNELPATLEFQEHIVRFVKKEEKRMPKQHPIGISTFADAKPPMHALINGNADWVTCDTAAGDYQNDPPAADGKKIIISDTDHIWGVGGDAIWVWKTFTRGSYPIYMDPLEGDSHKGPRRAMGQTRRIAERVDLARMIPDSSLSSTLYCLASSGREYVIFQPEAGRKFTVRVKPGKYDFEWFDMYGGKATRTGNIEVSGDREFNPESDAEAVLLLRATR